MATDEDRARQRDRLRFRCPTCENQVSGDDAACPACGADRPDRGWVRVTELVVHDRFSEPPSEADIPTISGTPPILSGTPARPPVHRTVYLDAPGARDWFDPEANHTMGLVATFLTSFVLTTFLVLAVFASRNDEGPVPVSGEVASAEPELPEPAAPVADAPVEVPAAPAAEAPSVPEAVQTLGGTYSANIDGSPATFLLRFEPENVLSATITSGDGVPTEAAGNYWREGEEVQFELEDQGAMTVSFYRGRISGRSMRGQMTSSAGGIRYFTGAR